jgi:signal peptidase I
VDTVWLLAALLLLVYGTIALCLWLGARLTRVPGLTVFRALAAALVLCLAMPPLRVGFWVLSDRLPAYALGILLSEIVVEVSLSCLLIKVLLRATWWQSLVAWLGTMLGGVLLLAVGFFVLRPLAIGAYAMPTFSMAPTLKGPHRCGTCPHCGSIACVLADPRIDPDPADPGMCDRCLQASQVEDIRPAVYPADRFLVNRTLRPRRWDVIVFRYPKEPSARYAMRLVGLPGEEVLVKDGAIWINGVKQDPPADIAARKFGTSPDSTLEPRWATPENPMRLGSDELFVLGDFSERASDSRFWGAVPTENVEGVVGAIYWPVSRWRVFR